MTDDLMADQVDQFDEEKDYLEELTKPGAKFDRSKYENESDMYKDIAKSKAFSDQHIDRIEKENSDWRTQYSDLQQKYNTGQKLEELLDKWDQRQPPSREQPESNEEVQPSYDPNEIESLISSKIQQNEQQKKEQDNYNRVRDRLTEHFGRNYKDALKEHADSLGLNDDDINRMAKTNPNLFFKTFDLNKSASGEKFETPPKSSGFTPKRQQKRTLSYYKELKKQDPNAWFDPKIYAQMEKDAFELGDEFYDA